MRMTGVEPAHPAALDPKSAFEIIPCEAFIYKDVH